MAGQAESARAAERYYAAFQDYLTGETRWRMESARRMERLVNNIGRRTEILLKNQRITAQMGRFIRDELESIRDEIPQMTKDLAKALSRRARLMKDVFSSIAENSNAVGRSALEKSVNGFRSAVKAAKGAVDSAREAVKSASQKALDARNKAVKALKKWEDALDEGASEAELAELRAAADAADAEANTAEAAAKEAKSTWVTAKTALESAGSKLNEAIDTLASVQREGLWGKTWTLAARGIGGLVQSFIEPFNNLFKRLGKVGDIVAGEYKTWAEALVRDEDPEAFLSKVVGEIDEAADAEKGIMKKQIAELQNLLLKSGDVTEEAVALASKWMSPSWRLAVAADADLRSLMAVDGGVADVFMFPVRALAFATRTLIRATFATLSKGFELLLGERAVIAISEAGLAVLDFTIEFALTMLSWPIMLAIMGLMSFIDIFRAHNVWDWLDYTISWIIPSEVINQDFTGLKIREYPDTSIPGKDKGIDPSNLLNAMESDYAEQKATIDFWGNEFITEINKHGHNYPVYKPMEEWEVKNRVPGKYISLDPAKRPLDSQGEVDACQQIEDELNTGELVDASGRLSNRDSGGHLVGSVLPKRKGFVRNLVNFPLYQNTMVWPPLDGTFIQTKGQLSPKNIDPTIRDLFLLWAKQGTWGPAYNLAKTHQTRQTAIDTNVRDYRNFLEPTRSDPLAWTQVKMWLGGNRGKRAIMAQGMFKIRLDVLEKEWVTDFNEQNVYWITDPDLRNMPTDTFTFVEMFKTDTGRYPYTPACRRFYQQVFTQNTVREWKTEFFPRAGPHSFVQTRGARPGEAAKYKTILENGEKYLQALRQKKGDVEQAFAQVTKDITWKVYVRDTKRERTPWGYVTRYLSQFMSELEGYVSYLGGKRAGDIWKQWAKIVAKQDIPLNTNSYNRTLFAAEFNQLVYSQDKGTGERIRKQIETKTGEFIENRLITSGLAKVDTDSWAQELRATAELVARPDVPVAFGNLHCRIIVFPKPTVTMFVVFRGTTNLFEWAIDFDATKSNIQRVAPGKVPGTFEIINAAARTGGPIPWDLLYNPNFHSVHRGFRRAWDGLRTIVKKRMREIFEKHDVEHCIVTGHSLGAAIAQLACLEVPSVIRRRTVGGFVKGKVTVGFIRPHAYMFSSPLVGDQRFANHFAQMVSESVQCYQDGDAVTTVPPFLVPSEKISQSLLAGTIRDLRIAAKADSGAWATAIALISVTFRAFRLPDVLQPDAWLDDSGRIDMKRVGSNIALLARAANEHRCVRGGGVFFRLNPRIAGDVTETSYDPGNTSAIFGMMAAGMLNPKRAMELHSIDKIRYLLHDVAAMHPDLFSAHAGDLPSWADAGKITPGTLNPIPRRIQELLRTPGAEIIGYARTKRHYDPFQLVPKSDVAEEEPIMFPIPAGEMARRFGTQRKRRKIRRWTEGEYHGY